MDNKNQDTGTTQETYNRGTRRIFWWLLLVLLLLALWLAVWADRSTGSFLGFGAENSGESASTTAIVSDNDSFGENSDFASDSTDSDSTDSDNADAATTSDSTEQDTANEADSASSEIIADGAGDEAGDVVESADGDSTDSSTSASTAVVPAADSAADTQNVDASASVDVSAGNSVTVASTVADSGVTGPTGLGIILNSTLVVADVVGETRDSGLRLYATASLDAPTREIYGVGEHLTLIEPSDDFDAYPVVVDGISWVRVRDDDGLIGWANWSLLVSE